MSSRLASGQPVFFIKTADKTISFIVHEDEHCLPELRLQSNLNTKFPPMNHTPNFLIPWIIIEHWLHY